YIHLKQIVVDEASLSSLKNIELVWQREQKAILEKIDSGEYLIILDKRGKQISSEALAQFLQKKMTQGVRSLTFVIGGSLGFSEDFLKNAHLVLSLSKMTFPHEMAKVILLEQLYRAFSILKGEKYHK
ncbi:MAG: 23S rRNA (pseudouridine(1915)-N(3))-methyltransferase RlmH, partial [Calditrichaeota bacterium]